MVVALRASSVMEFAPALTCTGWSHRSVWLLKRVEIMR